MKNRICIFFLLLFNETVFSQLPFLDGFESGNFTTGGWTNSGNAAISTSNPAQGIYCVEGPGTWGIVKTINGISTTFLTVEFSVKASQLNTTCMIFRIMDNAVHTSGGVFFDDLGFINGVNGPGTSGVIPLFAYDADTWYHFRFELNMTTKLYDLYINNVLHGNDFSFFSHNFTDPYLFTWSSVASSGTAWVDDVKIYAGTVGLEYPEKNSSEFIFYNFVESKLELNKNYSEKIEIQILNTTGQVVQSSCLSQGNSVDLSNLSNGFYLIHAINNNHIFKLRLFR